MADKSTALSSPTDRTVLYLSYDGMTDQLGASQVLPYLTGLSRRGHRIVLVSFEKPDCFKAGALLVREICAKSGIEWHPQRYHRQPPVISTIRDVARMGTVARRLHAQHQFDVAHCRSYVAALVGLSLKRRLGVRFLFDMRGFWADEKREGGSWPESNPLFRMVYRYFKRRENDFFKNADHVVSLTRNARDEIDGWPGLSLDRKQISVIPCCVDFAHFAPPTPEYRRSARATLGIPPERPVLAYLGSLGGLYMLPEMLRLFVAYRRRRPGALFLFITRDRPRLILEEAAKHGIGADEIAVHSASRDEVPRFIAAADVGVSFIRPSFSKKASSPTKLGEMLALGIPVITNAGVGDVAEVMVDTGGGVTVSNFDDATLSAAVDALLEQRISSDAIRSGARRWFDLNDGIEEYDRIYRSLPKNACRPNSAAAHAI